MTQSTMTHSEYRDEYCGAVTESLLEQTISIVGWVHRRRDHGGVIFLDMRDRAGILQVVVDPDTPEAFATADAVRPEYVLKITGRVRRRYEGTENNNMTSGQIELLGKEIEVFIVRLEEQIRLLKDIPSAAKFGGATGNFNAHHVAYPQVDWKNFGSSFVNGTLKLHHSFPTTQIEHYDHMAALFDTMKRINTIIIDLNRDFWQYISMEYFKQKIKKGEVGSSAMPHKVNPIDFENSEGNLGIANAIFEHLSAKLPISRLQRDLTDSTVLRNIGVPLGHTIIGFQSTLKGLNKLLLNESKFAKDLENNWAVVAEAIQTILRREGYPNPYEALKGLTRTNEVINQASMHAFIDTLDTSAAIKQELKAITPSNYTGI